MKGISIQTEEQLDLEFEPIISDKKTAYNKDFGTTANTVAKGDHGHTPAQVGLGNVTNDAQVKRSEMGTANGVATLDANGKVPASQSPSVDASAATKGNVKLSVAPAVPTEPVAVGVNDPKVKAGNELTYDIELHPDLDASSGWLKVYGKIASVQLVVFNEEGDIDYSPSATYAYTLENKGSGNGPQSTTTSVASFNSNMLNSGLNDSSKTYFRVTLPANVPVAVTVKVIISRHA